MDGIEPALLPTASSVSESAGNADPSNIDVHVQLTTGGRFTIRTSADDTAEELQRKIARRLQIPRERMKVLHKDQVLDKKPLKEYNITNGSKVTLLPSVKSGFSSTVQGTQQSVIQTIESLSDEQVDNFLSGSTPLTLAVSMGDHMMFIQLQLEQTHTTASHADVRHSRNIPTAISFHDSMRMKTKNLLSTSADDSAKDDSMLMVACHKASENTGSSVTPKKPSPRTRAEFSTTSKGEKSYGSDMAMKNHDRLDSGPYYSWPNLTSSKWQLFSDNGREYLDKLQSALLKMPVCASLSSLCPTEEATSSKSTSPSTSTDFTAGAVTRHHKSVFTKGCSKFSEPGPSGVKPATPLSQKPQVFTRCGSVTQPLPINTSIHPSKSSTCTSTAAKTKIPNPASSVTPQPRNDSRLLKRSLHKSYEKHSTRQGCRKRANCIASRKISSASLLLHQTTGVTGGRIARQMQRLRRLCASHQRCVAYSSREVATEISSIVRQAKHLRQSHTLDGFGCRKVHKPHKSCGDSGRNMRLNPSKSPRPSSESSSGAKKPKTSIDSLVMHGPGIFSGTYSGTLDPCVQEVDGKLKRDPKTILQLLNDLLSATLQYKGNLVDVGIIPRLLEDHFNITGNSEKVDTPSEQRCDESSKVTSMELVQDKSNSTLAHSPPSVSSVPCMSDPKVSHPSDSGTKSMPMLSAMAEASEPRCNSCERSARTEGSHHENRLHKHHCCHASTFGKSKSQASVCRKHRQYQGFSPMSVKKFKQLQHENSRSRNKMQELRQSIERKRRQRQNRKGLSDLNDSQQLPGSDVAGTPISEGVIFPTAVLPIPCEMEH